MWNKQHIKVTKAMGVYEIIQEKVGYTAHWTESW